MTTPVGKTVITRDVGFENLMKDQAKKMAKNYMDPVKDTVGTYSDNAIEKSNACSKKISAITFSASTANIMAKSIEAAEPLSKKTVRAVVNTCVNLTTETVVDKVIGWMKKH